MPWGGEAIFFFFFFFPGEPVRFYAMVDSVEAMGGPMVAIHLDAVLADYFDDRADVQDAAPEKALALLRIVSTHRRLGEFMEDESPLRPGDWVEIALTEDEGGSRVWVLGMENDVYRGPDDRFPRVPGRARVVSLVRLPTLDEGPEPRSVGAAAVPGMLARRRKGTRLKETFDLRRLGVLTPPALVNNVLRGRLLAGATATALDVGQAAFCTVSVGGRPLLYFDVGKPLWYHIHNLPKGFTPPVNPSAWVILSHWDYDHFAYGRESAAFRRMLWIAPAQRVGPGAHRFASHLWTAKRLILVGQGGSSRIRRGARIIRCTGRDNNGSGLALHLVGRHREVLLTGDADYGVIPGISRPLGGVTVPHHGSGAVPHAPVPPAAGVGARAVVSYGSPNRYGHPASAVVADHQAAGWTVSSTAGGGAGPRGDRDL